MTTPRPHAEIAARNAAVIWLYQRAADQACINARHHSLTACYPSWVEAQQTMANLAEELERNNAQRQHAMQCAINKTDSQRILELTAQLAEAQDA